MCQSRSSKKIFINGKIIQVDKCLADVIVFMNDKAQLKTLGSCCGHSRYPLTIVIKSPLGHNFEFISQKTIPRKKRFYVKDKDGYYFIPETVTETKSDEKAKER